MKKYLWQYDNNTEQSKKCRTSESSIGHDRQLDIRADCH